MAFLFKIGTFVILLGILAGMVFAVDYGASFIESEIIWFLSTLTGWSLIFPIDTLFFAVGVIFSFEIGWLFVTIYIWIIRNTQ